MNQEEKEKVIIYDTPLPEEERENHYGKVLKMPVRYHLIDCLKELKWGRPANDQKVLDSFIAYLELNDTGQPFSLEQIGLIFNKN